MRWQGNSNRPICYGGYGINKHGYINRGYGQRRNGQRYTSQKVQNAPKILKFELHRQGKNKNMSTYVRVIYFIVIKIQITYLSTTVLVLKTEKLKHNNSPLGSASITYYPFTQGNK